jgi:chromate transporter
MPTTSPARIFSVFVRLGCTSFGGPVAHLGYLREECVTRRGWLDDRAFADLVALCQFLPGPASSQLVFALGSRQAGLIGGIAASAGFTLPSAVLMIGFAYGLAQLGDLGDAGWIHGLKLAAVAVVAQAVWGMGRSLCPDRLRTTLALGAAAVLLVVPAALTQIAVLIAGAIAGWAVYGREAAPANAEPASGSARGRLAPVLALAGALLLVLPLVAREAGGRAWPLVDAFYRAGALVFGGGHVVLPLLEEALVPPGWIPLDTFLAGYGAAQAVPGPLFTFAAFLGTAIGGGAYGWAWGLLCLVALFLPGWLLVGGALPFWERLRRLPWATGCLQGANAAVVGILLAALYSPVATAAIRSPGDVAFALGAFALLHVWRTPPWLVVSTAAAFGGILR